MQVRVGSTDRAFLQGLTTRTDGLAVVSFPSSPCKPCGEEFVNHTKLHNHDCRGKEGGAGGAGRGRGVNLLRNFVAQPPTPHAYEPLSAKQEGPDESGNPQWSTLLAAKRLRLILPRRQWLVLLKRGTPSSWNVETSAVQSGTSAGAASSPVEAVLAVGEASPEFPLWRYYQWMVGLHRWSALAVCDRRPRPCGHQCVGCSDWR